MLLAFLGLDPTAFPYRRPFVLTSPQVPEENAKTEFALHRCADYPRDLKDAS